MRRINDGLNRFQRYRKWHPERVREISRNWRKNNPEKYKAGYTAWRKRHPKKWKALQRRSQLELCFGTGAVEHFDKQRKIQKNRCAVCRVRLKKACSDHNHKTKQWRGVLCDCCNRGLGLLKERPDVLRNAIAYLKKWETQWKQRNT